MSDRNPPEMSLSKFNPLEPAVIDPRRFASSSADGAGGVGGTDQLFTTVSGAVVAACDVSAGAGAL
jgi:hypothetical protein